MAVRILAACPLLLLLAACAAHPPSEAPDAPSLLTRGQWGAEPPVLPMQRHVLRHITIHHTGAPMQPERPLADKLRSLQRFSQEESVLADGSVKEPWADIPYHFYIAADGSVGEGREVHFVGDSNTGYDLEGKIHIVVEGNFEVETVTPEQYASLHRLAEALLLRWNMPRNAISGHRDHVETACPGDDLYARIPRLRSEIGGHP